MEGMKLVAEGKTKQVWNGKGGKTVIIQKDDITAGDGARRNVIPGKGDIAAITAANVFAYLESKGIRTHYLGMEAPNRMHVRPCQMVPLEVVTRRLATGSYLKRNPTVKEGHRFDPPLLEFFFKDDANHDPMVTPEWIVDNGLLKRYEIDSVGETARKVFLLLEGAWAKQNTTLVDLKIEFGRDIYTNELIVADEIANDHWRIWPEGDKNKMLDKQIYRNLTEVTPEALDKLLANYREVAGLTGKFLIN